MRSALRILLGAGGLLVVLLMIGYMALLRPDISYAGLEKQYAGPASRYIDLPGGFHAHYRDQGNRNGPPLLLIHGFGVSLNTWEPWVKLLAAKYRLVSVDLPGHGLTRSTGDFDPTAANDAEFVESFARAVGLERVTVVGNSRGGGIAWLLALRHPSRVERLVLIDASGWEWQSDRARARGGVWLFELLGNPLVRLAVRDLDKSRTFHQLLVSAYYDKALATEAMIQRYVDLSRAPGHRDILIRTLAATMEDRDVRATTEKLSHVAVPTLILWGDHDELVDPGDARKFADAIRGSKLIVYRNVGHVPMEEAAEKSAADLDDWLSKENL